MKKTLSIFIVLILFLTYSCKKDKPVTDSSRTNFDIGNVHYVSTNTTAYQTGFGQIIKAIGDNFELYIVMSDMINKTFSITDTLTGTDQAKVRCILKLNNDFKISTSGSVVYDSNKKSGSFTINIEDLNLTKGIIKVDSAVNQPIIDFTSISMLDLIGNPVTSGDINDWVIRTDWDIIERLVFNVKTPITTSSSYHLIEYPNPFYRALCLYTNMLPDHKVDLFLVNANFEIEQKYKGIPFRSCTLLMDNSVKGNYYRLYYRIYSDSEQLFGSGNLKCEQYY